MTENRAPDPCPICNADSKVAFAATFMHKYPARMLFCEGCGLLRAENPLWLAEAYESAISVLDTGILQRNWDLARETSAMLGQFFGQNGKFIDLAGGYGIFTRLMRDIGFDFKWSDDYCENLFAKGFADPALTDSYDAATAFEVLEHLPDPNKFFFESFAKTGAKTLICTTLAYYETPPPPSWWYYAFAGGQHISFYQLKTLRYFAKQLGMKFYTDGAFHVFTDKTISPLRWRLLRMKKPLYVMSWLARRKMETKTMSDHLSLAATRV